MVEEVTQEQASEKEIANSNTTNYLPIEMFFILLILLFLSGFITLFLLRWRKKHKNNLIIIPEQLLDETSDLKSKISFGDLFDEDSFLRIILYGIFLPSNSYSNYR